MCGFTGDKIAGVTESAITILTFVGYLWPLERARMVAMAHAMLQGEVQFAAATVSVMSVGRADEDQDALRNIFDTSSWELDTSHSVQTALSSLQAADVSVVLCESATWREMLEALSHLPDPPLLVVTSRHADERLWAEALNLGAYDVLAKPYEPTEVIRVVSAAHLRRQHRNTPARMAGA
ncbi:hypothetical protein SBA3_2010012 [Candidatus Sulfopaludibacter sp. SbA3]|nr:hypothetical protein SBA3_2010012 [Candidatus Sulfopaludibacter sp. SbA3]